MATSTSSSGPKISVVDMLRFAASSVDLKKLAAEHFQRCGTTGCDKLSVGLVCKRCSKFACLGHVYFTASAPPEPLCAECIADTVTKKPKTKRSKK